jgi:hypothetical protein
MKITIILYKLGDQYVIAYYSVEVLFGVNVIVPDIRENVGNETSNAVGGICFGTAHPYSLEVAKSSFHILARKLVAFRR